MSLHPASKRYFVARKKVGNNRLKGFKQLLAIILKGFHAVAASN
jgi:hypothetical protein